MNLFTKSYFLTLLCLAISFSSFSANITILESQSVHPLHKMDNNWESIATSMGHTPTIVDQTFLDDFSNLSGTDILILSSGLVEIPDSRKSIILQFVQAGGNVYIQSEYQTDLPGNATFKYIADNLGNTFNWLDEVTGNLSPMEVVGELSENLEEGNNIGYYWYGTSGSGDANFIPFLKHNDKDWGFIFCSSDMTLGKVITTSDQDWVRTSNKNSLMVNIISYLANNTANNALPTVAIQSTNDPCDNSFTFSATIQNNLAGLLVEWLINGQIVANENALSFSSNSLIDGDVVECKISMSNACANYDHVSNPILIAPIFPTEAPEISISIDNVSICEGQIAAFAATPSQIDNASNISYQWLVNGSLAAGATTLNFSPDFLNDQDLIACQITYDDDCNTGAVVTSNEVSVSVAPSLSPTVSIDADVIEICEGETITFTANGTDLGADPVYQWQINGVNTGDNNPVFTSSILTNGQNVNCLIFIQDLCSTTNEANSNTISITVNEIVNPGIEITSSTNQICNGEEVSFTATASDFGTNPTYQWQVDGLNVGMNQPNFSTTTLQDGQQITCILSVVESCAASAAVTSAPISISVSQGEIPTLNIESNASLVCTGESISFTAAGNNHGQNPVYEWFVNGVSSGINTMTFTLDNINSINEVSCIVTNPDACPINDTATSNSLTVGNSSVSLEALELIDEACSATDGAIEVTTNGGQLPFSFAWSNGATTASASNLAAGTYTVTATDANGCSAISSFEINNVEAPQINEVLLSALDCSGENGGAEVILENPSAGTSFAWFNAEGDVIGNTSKLEDLLPGTYEIAVTNEHGCEVFESLTIEEVSALAVVVDEDLRLNLGSTVNLDAVVNTSANVTYEWFPAEGLSCTDCPNPRANPTSSTKYTVIVTNEQGCTASDEVLIHLIPNDQIFIPNAFSPNGDGVNDFFTAFAGTNVAQIKTLKVFDRWGAEVFSNKDFSANIETEGWNGTYKGKVMNGGVYVYFVEVEYIDGSVKIKKGDLSITQ